MKRTFLLAGNVLLGLVCGVSLRLWIPMSDSPWLGGAPKAQPLVPLVGLDQTPPTPAADANITSSTTPVNFIQRLATAAAATMAGFAEEALEECFGGFPTGNMIVVLQRWLELAPQDAYAWWRKLPTLKREGLRGSIFKEWAKLDPKTASRMQADYADMMLSITQPPELADLLEQNPAGALDLALALAPGLGRAKATERALLALAKQDFDLAFNKLLGLQGQQDISGLASRLIGNLAMTDVTKALDATRLLPVGAMRQKAMESLAMAASANDKSTNVLDWISQLPPGPDQVAALAGVGKGTDTPELSLRSLFKNAAEKDPAAAAALLSQMSPTDFRRRNDAASGIYEAWQRTDPTAALKWATEQPAGTFTSLTTAIFNHLRDQGPDFLNKLGLDPNRSDWLNPDTLTKAIQKPGGIELARAIGGEEGGKLWALAQQSKVNNIEGKPAQEFIAAMPEDAFRAAAATRMARNLAQIDPPAAMALVDLAGGTMPAEEMTMLGRTLARTNPLETSQWLQGMVPSATRDAFVAQLAPIVLADGDAAASFQWATSISNESQQLQLAAPAFANWLLADPAAAQAALQSATVSDALKLELQKLTIP